MYSVIRPAAASAASLLSRKARIAPTTATTAAAAILVNQVQVRHLRLQKHIQEHVDNNPDLRTIVDEFSVPGKFHKFLFPSKRHQKRDAKVSEPRPPEPWASPSSSLLASGHDSLTKGDKPRVSKKMAQRVSRAIHDILYDPQFGVCAETGEAPSWRVDKIDVTGSGRVTVWWVPVDQVHSAMLMDNEYMVDELNGMAKSVKRALQTRLKLRKAEVPKIVFMRRDTSLELLLDIVEEELVIASELAEVDAEDVSVDLGSDAGAGVKVDLMQTGDAGSGAGPAAAPALSDSSLDQGPRIDLFKRM